MVLRPQTDREIRNVLLAIGKSEEIRVTAIDLEFLESTAYRFGGEWTVEQRARAAQIVERYRHKL